jgi:hypothetical protein
LLFHGGLRFISLFWEHVRVPKRSHRRHILQVAMAAVLRWWEALLQSTIDSVADREVANRGQRWCEVVLPSIVGAAPTCGPQCSHRRPIVLSIGMLQTGGGNGVQWCYNGPPELLQGFVYVAAMVDDGVAEGFVSLLQAGLRDAASGGKPCYRRCAVLLQGSSGVAARVEGGADGRAMSDVSRRVQRRSYSKLVQGA